MTKPASVQPGQSRLPLTPTEVLHIEHLGKRSFKVSPRVARTGQITGRRETLGPGLRPQGAFLRRELPGGRPGERTREEDARAQ